MFYLSVLQNNNSNKLTLQINLYSDEKNNINYSGTIVPIKYFVNVY